MSLTQSEKNRQIVPASSDPALVSPTHRVERAAGEFRRGVPVLIRPRAGGLSLTAAAETVGDQTMRLMAAAAGRGSLMITHDRAATLKIPLYTEGVISIPLAGDVTAEFVRAIARPNFPVGRVGNPCPVSLRHVLPPSVDLYRPLLGPPLSRPHVWISKGHMPANKI